MSNDELYEALAAVGTEVAKSLRMQWRRYGEWSEAQTRLAQALVSRCDPVNDALCTLAALPEFLRRTSRKTGACIVMAGVLENTYNGGTVSIKRHKRGGWWVTDGRGVLYAEIRDDGTVVPRKAFYPGVACLLDELEGDPVGFVARVGKRTNTCCFCRSPLTDAPSVEAGYGPVCAKQYRLPWGG